MSRLHTPHFCFKTLQGAPYWSVPLTALNTTAAQGVVWTSTLSSLVLLKNDGRTLPLALGRKVAVIGPHGRDTMSLVSNYIGQICPVETHIGNTTCLRSVYSAIALANNAAGGSTTFAPGMANLTTNDTSPFAAAVALARASDAVVLVLGIDGTIENEMLDRTSISLPGAQHALAAAIAAVGVPVALVLLHGGVVDVSPEVVNAGIGAIVSAGYPGTRGGDAVAATLFGQNDHLGGKTGATWYYTNYTTSIAMSEMEMDVGVGRGYRYFSGPVVFPFGYGLALTTFTLSPVAGAFPEGGLTSASNGVEFTTLPPVAVSARTIAAAPLRSLTYSINVTNTGNVTGDEVVQVYMWPMALPLQRSSRLIRQLLDFQRVHLAPGESTTVSFGVTARSLCLVDRLSGHTVSTPGVFRLQFTNGAGVELTHTVSVAGPESVVERFPGS